MMFFADDAYIDGQWQKNVVLSWDEDGVLLEVKVGATYSSEIERAKGPVIPAMPNLHSHAFQRAMAGMVEYRAQATDSFWSWRDLMYRLALKIQPDQLVGIARWLYIEMLKAGYTTVCEFHYLHHQPNGQIYQPANQLMLAIIEAAQEAKIGLTLLPVLYQYAGFGEQAPREDQRRFLNTPEQFLKILSDTIRECPSTSLLHYGIAPHSLRAVSSHTLNDIVESAQQLLPNLPIHIHIAEQLAEVQESIAHYHARPVEWLLDHAKVDASWCLVHATHLTEAEVTAIAKSQAVVGLCLTTEANLGDGIFPAQSYLAQSGRWGIGSDSHIAVDWRTELCLLEYGQRLITHQRNVLASSAQPYVADRLFNEALAGGAQASGQRVGCLKVGYRADWLVLDASHPNIAEHPYSSWLSGCVFAQQWKSPILDVFCQGQAVIRERSHPQEEQALHSYRKIIKNLLQ